LRREGVRKLDLIVISHLHKDHVGGLLPLCNEIEVRELWSNWVPQSDDFIEMFLPRNGSGGAKNLVLALQEFLKALHRLNKSNTRIENVSQWKKQTYRGLGKNIRVTVSGADPYLYTLQNDIFNKNVSFMEFDKFINDTSLRLYITYKGYTVQLPGDVSAAYWERESPEKCNILKVPHHGHKDSITKTLLEYLRPDYAVISVSNDRQDPCPHPEILKLINNYTNKVYFTDDVSCANQKFIKPTTQEPVLQGRQADGVCTLRNESKRLLRIGKPEHPDKGRSTVNH
jgi:competence protein ComEC